MYFAFQHAHLGTADTFGKNVNQCDIYIVDRLRKDKRRVGQALLTDTPTLWLRTSLLGLNAIGAKFGL